MLHRTTLGRHALEALCPSRPNRVACNGCSVSQWDRQTSRGIKDLHDRTTVGSAARPWRLGRSTCIGFGRLCHMQLTLNALASLCRRAGAFGQTVLCTGRVVAAVQEDHSSQLSHQRGLQLEQGQLLLVQQKARVCRWRHGGVLRERGVVPTTFVLGLLTFSDMVHCLKAAGRPAHA